MSTSPDNWMTPPAHLLCYRPPPGQLNVQLPGPAAYFSHWPKGGSCRLLPALHTRPANGQRSSGSTSGPFNRTKRARPFTDLLQSATKKKTHLVPWKSPRCIICFAHWTQLLRPRRGTARTISGQLRRAVLDTSACCACQGSKWLGLIAQLPDLWEPPREEVSSPRHHHRLPSTWCSSGKAHLLESLKPDQWLHGH